MENGTVFESFTIKGVTFKNRILRSSIGGRTAYYDGTVTSAWKNFERRFAENDVAGIISATLTVDERRWLPLEYPKISNDKFIKPLREGSQEIQNSGANTSSRSETEIIKPKQAYFLKKRMQNRLLRVLISCTATGIRSSRCPSEK